MQEDPALLNEWPDWDPKTHAIDWDLDHGYAQTPYGKKRPCPHRVLAWAPRRLASAFFLGIFEQTATGKMFASDRNIVV